jgi:hypothetical protein
MTELSGDLDLTLKALRTEVIREERMEDLDGDWAPVLPILGQID